MSAEDILNEIKNHVMKTAPGNAAITDVQFEGPEVVIYAKNPEIFSNTFVRELAKLFRKRIAIRPDPSVLMEPEIAKKKILEIIPDDAEITNCIFDANTGEIIIESKKPGLVIGKEGSTLEELKKEIKWAPKPVRTPPISSETVNAIRATLYRERMDVKEILRRVGKVIHRDVKLREDSWIRMSFLGGAREVGRTCNYLQTPESRILIDCGINVAMDGDRAFPHFDAPEFAVEEIDAVVVTHAHLDHCGFVPGLFRYGYDGPIYCSKPTRDLMTLLQKDYIDIAEKEGKVVPYSSKDIKKCVKHIIPIDYGVTTDVAPAIKLTMHNAGHILGSAIAHCHIGDGLYNIAYTGDIKFEASRLLEPAVCNFPRLETLIIESTYGAYDDVLPDKGETEQNFLKVIAETIKRKGKIIIPVFGIGRAQELMLVLEEGYNQGIFNAPVYLDGMIWEATAIHTAYPEYLSKNMRNRIFHEGDNPFLSEVFKKVRNTNNRRNIIDSDEPCIILTTSGMLSGGPSVEYFKSLAHDERNAIVFVGYQSEGTMGRKIQRGWNEIPVMNRNGKSRAVKVNLSVHTFEGFSGHSDRRQLIKYLRKLKPMPDRILTVHGESSKCIDLASAAYKLFKKETRAPMNLDAVRLK
ncbi:beta-CASP ribonuclease aCPSF1 [Methanococcus aeolicus]|uniref:Transcription termination factor FttA n=1 Tax=Methanococcus aeolicus (strain ATCC BAA-1280 / DSM 17508 / OCM 812 / Nankai-3) TaxID=419665 RepID=A6UT19_META3|nr:beta-CASP ribonuclease aCPSF1 [Methanococcus aeolicus]ABR55641.1 beta-lactamase domain protein [Methanococcus aeolicus Nankai-3]UXM85141.1 beta-CASP ribonuclease aCPSF1 [Methanococcus aeolicus]